MICVCEPLCKGVEHEKVNSGFLTALRLAFPEEEIHFYAHASHVSAIREALATDKVNIENLKTISIDLPREVGIAGKNRFRSLFRMIFDAIQAKGEDRCFLLSFSRESLFAIKELKQEPKYEPFRFNFVLHGIFETLTRGLLPDSVIRFPISQLPPRRLLERVSKLSFRRIAIGLSQLTERKVQQPSEDSEFAAVTSDVKSLLEWQHTDDYRYITLSPHALRNAGKYIDTEYINIFNVTMPLNFGPVCSGPKNSFAKFAVYGGNTDPLPLHNIATVLAERKPTKQYEIRVISKNKYGTEGIRSVTQVGKWGANLTRAEMEHSIADIDFILLLFDENKYTLTCSGALMDAISLVKPIIHFDNENINQFNPTNKPIGIRCFSFEEYVSQLKEIVENYSQFQPEIAKFRESLIDCRERCSIALSAPGLRRSFCW